MTDIIQALSLLEQIPVDMVLDIPLDFMHLICLGVMKRLLLLWCSNAKPPSKLSSRQISHISDNLSVIAPHVPCEFSRRCRSLLELKGWKATEFALFLFYVGPIVLKDMLSADAYLNFQVLHVASTILSRTDVLADQSAINYAEMLMKYFVESFTTLYGRKHVSHNIYNTLHIANDVRRFGSMHSFSAFQFENFLGSIKRQLRSGSKPLQQIIKRKFEEYNNLSVENITTEASFSVFKKHNLGPLIENSHSPQFKEIKFPNYTLNTTKGNNCCCTEDKSIVSIENFVSYEGKIVAIGRKFLQRSDFYDNPCKSSDFNIYLVDRLSKLQAWDIKDISCKMAKLPYKNSFVVFPLNHCQ